MNRYLVMMIRQAHVDPAVVPLHQQYLEDLRAQGHNEMSGPFSDKSGGAYLLRAHSMDEALSIAHRDPAHLSGSWAITVYEWLAH